MTIVFERTANGPATHAIVIGVGYYAHLPGGAGPLIQDVQLWQGLGQLESPPKSALEVADFLVGTADAAGEVVSGYRNTAAPLGSVDLYISKPGNGDAAVETFTPKRGPFANQALPIERATWANVERGVVSWVKDRLTSPQDIAVFYFCGHGTQRGDFVNLFTESFGEKPFKPMQTTIRFSELVGGMNRCPARKQAYFLDACRSEPEALKKMSPEQGDPIIAIDDNDQPSPIERDVSVLVGTGKDKSAFGRAGEVSYFTRQLLRAIKEGPAWIDEKAPWKAWTVNTNNLAARVNELMVLEAELLRAPRQSAFQRAQEHIGFVLHEPRGVPVVPVIIACSPAPGVAAAVSLTDPGGGPSPTIQRVDGVWETALTAKEGYQVVVSENGNALGQATFVVRPATQWVRSP